MTDPTQANAASREVRALAEAFIAAESEHTVRDMAGHVGDEVHGVLKRHAMMMKTTGGAVAVGVLAAVQLLGDTLEFARRSMDTEQERREVGDAIGLLFRQNAPTDLGLAALTDTAPTDDADRTMEDYSYDELWGAIAASTRIDGGIVAISVVKFREAIRALSAAQPPLKEEGQDNG